jgi:uncharacterized membrane protein
MTKVKEKQNMQMRGQAYRNVCSKGVVVGIAITIVFFVLGTISAISADVKYRKEQFKKAQNG